MTGTAWKRWKTWWHGATGYSRSARYTRNTWRERKGGEFCVLEEDAFINKRALNADFRVSISRKLQFIGWFLDVFLFPWLICVIFRVHLVETEPMEERGRQDHKA